MSWDIKITKNSTSNINNVDFNNLPFGNTYTDHMFVANYKDGAWKDCRIEPLKPLELHPGTFALHYGQSIFEGLKAERSPEGEIIIFRPQENAKRFIKSANRLALPEVPEDLFMQAIEELIKIDEKWVPQGMDNTSLYIRPVLFGSDPTLGVKIGTEFMFVVLIGPTGPYYPEPVNVYVEDKYVRAVPGGTGYAKFAGNYAATLLPARLAKEKGCNQVLWTDAFEHKYLQEIGTMNFFVMIDNVLRTPSLEEDTILHGITRNSLITLAKENGIKVQEGPISIDELVEATEQNNVQDIFGAGTAAVVAPIHGFVYQDKKFDLSHIDRKVSVQLKKALVDIKSGNVKDTHGWIHTLNSNIAKNGH